MRRVLLVDTSGSDTLDITNKVHSIVIAKSETQPYTTVTFTVSVEEEEAILTERCNNWDHIYLEWEQRGHFGETLDLKSGKYYVYSINVQPIGVVGYDDKGADTGRFLVEIVCVPPTFVYLRETITLSLMPADISKVLRQILGGVRHYFSPPSVRTIPQLFIPVMPRLDALRYLVGKLGIYDTPAFLIADIDSVSLLSLADSVNRVEATVWYTPLRENLQISETHHLAEAITVHPGGAHLVGLTQPNYKSKVYTPYSLCDEYDVPSNQVARLGRAKQKVLRSYRATLASFTPTQTISYVRNLHLANTYMIALRRVGKILHLKPGMICELVVDERRSRQLSGKYVVSGVSVVLTYIRGTKLRGSLVLKRYSI